MHRLPVVGVMLTESAEATSPKPTEGEGAVRKRMNELA
jgi:hypothetical protein